MSPLKSRAEDYDPQADYPDDTYVAGYAGFSVRDEETNEPILKARSVQGEMKDYVYWNFLIASGPHQGTRVPGSTPWKGIDLAIDPESQEEYIRLGVAGERRPNLIEWCEKCGVEWEAFDKEIKIDPPFTPIKMLVGLEAWMGRLAEAGHLVMITVKNGWVHWEGGVAALPEDIRQMIKATGGQAVPSIAEKHPEFKRVQEYANVLFDLSHRTQKATDVEVVKELLPSKRMIAAHLAETYAIPVGQGMTNLLSLDQLYEVIGWLSERLDQAEVTYPAFATPEKEDDFEDIPF